MVNNSIKKLALGGMFIALGLILPLITGQIPKIGSALLPMHIPVLLCGLICGYKYGLFVGFVLPILRYMLFGMPPLFPIGLAMTFELATYGFAIGFLHQKLHDQIVKSLIISMILGRLVWGSVQFLLLGVAGNTFTWQLFIAGAFLNAIPGIIFQLILIPSLMYALKLRYQINGELSL